MINNLNVFIAVISVFSGSVYFIVNTLLNHQRWLLNRQSDNQKTDLTLENNLELIRQQLQYINKDINNIQEHLNKLDTSYNDLKNIVIKLDNNSFKRKSDNID